MDSFNVFRILADLAHASSKGILIFAIFWNKSAEGVSLLTQFLYILVFLSRYLDLFWSAPGWNFAFKILYITTSFFIVYLMMRVYPRTREKEAAWKLAGWSLLGCIILTPLTVLIFATDAFWVFREEVWTFSIILESVCVLPQLLLLRQTSVPTVLDSYYLVALGSYRFLYVLNWIERGIGGKRVIARSVIFGVIQTLLYVDFAWVYYTRQRVKLRGGGVVDSDDLSKSFLVRRFIGTRSQNPDDDIVDDGEAAMPQQESGRILPSTQNAGKSWGARGVSVSADDTLHEHDRRTLPQMADPAQFEDDEDDDEDAPALPAKDHAQAEVSSSANEWRSST